MHTEVLVAMISGAAGVIGAIIAWIQTIRANRLKAEVDIAIERIKSEAALALETIKIENEHRHKAFEAASQACTPIEAALDQAWQDIQAVKEVVAKLLSPAGFEKPQALSSLGPAVLSIEEGYRRYGASIPESARAAWHKAKNCTGVIELTIREQSDALPFTGTVIEDLTKFRNELTDQQIAMVAAREGVRGALVERLLRLALVKN